MFVALVMIRWHVDRVPAAARAIVGFGGVTEEIRHVEGLECTESGVAFGLLSEEHTDAARAGFE